MPLFSLQKRHIWFFLCVIQCGIVASILYATQFDRQGSTASAATPVVDESSTYLRYDIDGGTGTVTTSVQLDSEPSGSVTVYVHESAYGIDVGDPTRSDDALELTFDATNWNIPQEVTITITEQAIPGTVYVEFVTFDGIIAQPQQKYIVLYSSTLTPDLDETKILGSASAYYLYGYIPGLQGEQELCVGVNTADHTQPLSITMYSEFPGIYLSTTTLSIPVGESSDCVTFDIDTDVLPLAEIGRDGYLRDMITYYVESADLSKHGAVMSSQLLTFYFMNPSCYTGTADTAVIDVTTSTASSTIRCSVNMPSDFTAATVQVDHTGDGTLFVDESIAIDSGGGYSPTLSFGAQIDRTAIPILQQQFYSLLVSFDSPDVAIDGRERWISAVAYPAFEMSATSFSDTGTSTIVTLTPAFDPGADSYEFVFHPQTYSYFDSFTVTPSHTVIDASNYDEPITLLLEYDLADGAVDPYVYVTFGSTVGLLNEYFFLYMSSDDEGGEEVSDNIVGGPFLFSGTSQLTATTTPLVDTDITLTVELTSSPEEPIYLTVYDTYQALTLVDTDLSTTTYRQYVFDDTNWNIPQELPIRVAAGTPPGSYVIDASFVYDYPYLQTSLANTLTYTIPQTASEDSRYSGINATSQYLYSFTSNGSLCISLMSPDVSVENPLNLELLSVMPGMTFDTTTGTMDTAYEQVCFSYTLDRSEMPRNQFGLFGSLNDAIVLGVSSIDDAETPYIRLLPVYEYGAFGVGSYVPPMDVGPTRVTTTMQYSMSGNIVDYLGWTATTQFPGITVNVSDNTAEIGIDRTAVYLSGISSFNNMIFATISSSNPNWDGATQVLYTYNLPVYDVVSDTELSVGDTSGVFSFIPLYQPLDWYVTPFLGANTVSAAFSPPIPMEGIQVLNTETWLTDVYHVPFTYSASPFNFNFLSISLNSLSTSYTFTGGPPSVSVYNSGDTIIFVEGEDSAVVTTTLAFSGDPGESVTVTFTNTDGVDISDILVFDAADAVGVSSTYSIMRDSSDYQDPIVLPLYFSGLNSADLSDGWEIVTVSICNENYCSESTVYIYYDLINIDAATISVTTHDALVFAPEETLWANILVSGILYADDTLDETSAELTVLSGSDRLELAQNLIYNGSFEAGSGVLPWVDADVFNVSYDDDMIFVSSTDGDAAYEGTWYVSLLPEIGAKPGAVPATFALDSMDRIVSNTGGSLTFDFAYRQGGDVAADMVLFIPESCGGGGGSQFLYNTVTEGWDCVNLMEFNQFDPAYAAYLYELPPVADWDVVTVPLMIPNIYEEMTDPFRVEGEGVQVRMVWFNNSLVADDTLDIDAVSMVDPLSWATTTSFTVLGYDEADIIYGIKLRRTSEVLTIAEQGQLLFSIDSLDSRVMAPDAVPYTLRADEPDGEEEEPAPSTGGSRGNSAILPRLAQALSNGTFVINDGALTTTERIVSLSFEGFGQLFGVAISNQPTFAGVSFQPFRRVMQYVLEDIPGIQTIYAKFRTYDGQTITLSDAIEYVLGQTESTTVSDPEPESASNCTLIPNTPYKTRTSAAVYFITPQCTKRVFRSPETYFTHYTSWDQVRLADTEVVDTIPLDSTYPTMYVGTRAARDGALMRLPNSADVYFLGEGEWRWIRSEEIFMSLGYEWSWIEVVEPNVFARYQVGTPITQVVPPMGSIVQFVTRANTYYRITPSGGPFDTLGSYTLITEGLEADLQRTYRTDRIPTLPLSAWSWL